MSDVASVMDDKGAVTTLQARPPESSVLGTTPVQTVSDPVHRHRCGASCILHHHFRLCTFSLRQVLILIRRCGRSIVDLQAEMVRFIALSIKFPHFSVVKISERVYYDLLLVFVTTIGYRYLTKSYRVVLICCYLLT